MARLSPIVIISLSVNSILGIANRIAQICYYCLTDFSGKQIVKTTALTFTILPSAIHCFMVIIYTLFHNEEMLTPKVKVKNFFLYLFSTEALFPIGMQKSFKSKYSHYTDNIIVSMKVLNALHIMFVSLPQLLIIPIYSSSIEKLGAIDIVSLVMSVVFILWSVAYFFLCETNEEIYYDELSCFVHQD